MNATKKVAAKGFRTEKRTCQNDAGGYSVQVARRAWKTPFWNGTDSESMVIIETFGRTDVGTVREHNEDNFLVANLDTGDRSLLPDNRVHHVSPVGSLFVVCDGMGGAAAGEVASGMAVDSIYQKMREQPLPQTRRQLAERLFAALDFANAGIWETAQKNRQQTGMGTTCTAAALNDGVLLLAQVGDSRAYLIRNQKIIQLTKDQTLLHRLLELGQLTPDEAARFEHNHVILQALGVRSAVEPVLSVVELRQNDMLLLCSDGLNDALTDDEVLSIILNTPRQEPVEVCRGLTSRACENKAHDNVTVIFCRFSGDLLDAAVDTALPYLEIPRDQVATHALLDSMFMEDDKPEVTQVFGSYHLNLQMQKNENKPK